MKIIDITWVIDPNPRAFALQVLDHLKNGWSCHGPVKSMRLLAKPSTIVSVQMLVRWG
jgi:hypothetical protein